MAVQIETLEKRLEQKKAAIVKRAATTKKHAARYLKNRKTKSEEDMKWDFSFSDMKDSAKKLQYLIWERRDIERELAKLVANKPILPEVLITYRDQLHQSFTKSRIEHREMLKEIWKNDHEQNYHLDNDIWDKFVNFKYRSFFKYDNMTGKHILRDGREIEDCDLEDYKKFVASDNAGAFRRAHQDAMDETDEHIDERSKKDACILVEDLYNRTKIHTGEAIDCSDLRIDFDNRGYSIINGIVRGDRGGCKVESISAGGYNIQRWHIRVLVHSLKV